MTTAIIIALAVAVLALVESLNHNIYSGAGRLRFPLCWNACLYEHGAQLAKRAGG